MLRAFSPDSRSKDEVEAVYGAVSGGKERGPRAARGRLLTAAGRFAGDAYRNVSISQLVADAAVQPPTLYHYFGDKEGLFVEWAVASIEALGNRIRHGLQPPADFQEALSHVGRCLASPEFPDILRLQRDAGTLDRPESQEQIVEALHRAVFEPVYAIFLVGMERRLLKTEPVRRTTAVFISAAMAYRPGGPLHDPDESEGMEWWVSRFLRGFGASE